MSAKDTSARQTRAARRRFGDQDADEGGFLGRWSRRKEEARHGTLRDETATPAAVPPPVATAGEPAATPSEPAKEHGEAAVPEDLPDVETLDASSDYAAFMREGVPEDLRRAALRKLWLSDPVYANLDGLLEYGGDYSKVGMVKQAVKTAWQVGRGFLDAQDAGREAGAAEPEQKQEQDDTHQVASDHAEERHPDSDDMTDAQASRHDDPASPEDDTTT